MAKLKHSLQVGSDKVGFLNESGDIEAVFDRSQVVECDEFMKAKGIDLWDVPNSWAICLREFFKECVDRR